MFIISSEILCQTYPLCSPSSIGNMCHYVLHVIGGCLFVSCWMKMFENSESLHRNGRTPSLPVRLLKLWSTLHHGKIRRRETCLRRGRRDCFWMPIRVLALKWQERMVEIVVRNSVTATRYCSQTRICRQKLLRGYLQSYRLERLTNMNANMQRSSWHWPFGN
jgi:hypothetical protein